MSDLPITKYTVEDKDITYDPSILAFRYSERKDCKNCYKPVMRDSWGKKIQSQEELERFIEANRERGVVGLGTKVTSVVYGLISIPAVIVFELVFFPFCLVADYNVKKFRRKAEEAYHAGRDAFAEGNPDAALVKLGLARIGESVLILGSDVDYWRGRAFEAKGSLEEAEHAYRTFISYSEQSIPDWFKKKYEDDPSWMEKAQDAQERIKKIRMAGPAEN